MRILRLERIGVGLEEPLADEHVADEPPQPLLARQAAEHLAPRGQRRGNVLEPEARDLLDEVDLAADVAGAPVRHAHLPVLAHLEAEPLEPLPLLALGELDPDHLLGPLGPEPDDRPARAAPPCTSVEPTQRAPASSTRSCVA